MTYRLSGYLCVRICPECELPLPGARVRLYRPTPDEAAPAIAVADPNDTFALPESDELTVKSERILAETHTDRSGRFIARIGDDAGYDGGPVQIGVRVEQPPHEPAGQVEPIEANITTLQPAWKQTEGGLAAAWRYCIPHRYWCYILARYGIWAVCGWVKHCQSQLPVPGVRVAAFDADWLQDDDLGAAMTDGNGRFVLYFGRADFEKTPFSPAIDLELIGGPDLYFKVETPGGVELLSEPQARGREPDRENAGNCTCVTLCVEAPESIYDNPQFTHIGDFNIAADIDGTTGLTNKAKGGHGGPGFGFFGGLKLKGFCAKTQSGDATKIMHYRFLYLDPATSTEQPITGSKVLESVVGARIVPWDQFGTGVQLTYQDIVIKGSGSASPTDAYPTPPVVPPGTPWGPVPAHVLVPDADGWIRVDQHALDNGFQGTLLRFNSGTVVSSGIPTQPGAGHDPAVSAENGIQLAIMFETAIDPSDATTYDRQAIQAMPLINNWNEVRQLDIQQFHSGALAGCTPLSSDLNVLYTADHEVMRSWSLDIQTSASVPGGIPALPQGSGPRGGFGNHHVDISTWPSCSYQVWLHTQRALTNGEYDDDVDSSLVTFCK